MLSSSSSSATLSVIILFLLNLTMPASTMYSPFANGIQFSDSIANCHMFRRFSRSIEEPKKCINRHALCRYWARNGQCWKNSDFMQKTCPGACNPACYCKGNWEEPINCVNTVAYCDYWAEHGACSVYRDYMMWKCQKACDYRCKPQFSINFTVNKMKPTYETNKYAMEKTPRQAAKAQKITVMKLSPDMSKVTKE
ncbi:hypothetical protein T10_11482 [Trichinella papuae]|uniref:ShKT domain-containing protein n=1 Tax=Trichinella papuae TaxID=268474 RepID=A0A0V1M383_9BILA|nr:hypothetical protein T10_11482 [Trichinella papuae]